MGRTFHRSISTTPALICFAESAETPVQHYYYLLLHFLSATTSEAIFSLLSASFQTSLFVTKIGHDDLRRDYMYMHRGISFKRGEKIFKSKKNWKNDSNCFDLILSSISYVTGQIAFKTSVSAENCCKDSCEDSFRIKVRFFQKW